MSTKSRSESSLLERVDELSPTERKELYERLSAKREETFFQHRAKYAKAIDKKELHAAREALDGTEFAGVEIYRADNPMLEYCRENPGDCFRVSTDLEDLIPDIQAFVDLRRSYVEDLVEEGLLDIEARYFGSGSPGELGTGFDGTGPTGAPVPEEPVITITVPDEGTLDISPDDLDDIVGRFGSVTIDLGDRFDPIAGMEEPMDPRTESLVKLLTWWSNNPRTHIGAYLTVRRDDDE